MNNIPAHVGSRIRFYRKALGLTLDEFASMINKNKSTVSKYENGDIVIDIETLFTIADVLNITVAHLMDYNTGKATKKNISLPVGFFQSPGCYYMYHLEGSSNKIVRSVIEIICLSEQDGTYSALFYNNISSYENLHSCHYYYKGEIDFSDMYINFVFQNQTNQAEKAFIVVINSLKQGHQTFGMVSGISSAYLVPLAYKAMFSRTIIKDEKYIVDSLKMTKEDLDFLKRNNIFLLVSSHSG